MPMHPSRPRHSPPDTGSDHPAVELARERPALHRIVVVGGGAGGLDLASRLGRDLGSCGLAEVLLIDPALTHVWKPVLHAVAAGSSGSGDSRVDFLAQARRHHFRFHLGRLDGLDRGRQEVMLEPLVDGDGCEIAPRRSVAYDTLVLALGSIVNDFGTPGVQEHTLRLDSSADARRLHRRLLAACARAEVHDDGPVEVVIVGGGATGVELAAELQDAVRDLADYGVNLRRMAQPVWIRIVERGPRLLATLPEPTAARALAELRLRGIEVLLGSAVEAVEAGAVQLAGGARLAAHISVWCAGIQGPAVLERLDGLELSAARQLVVRPTLQTTRDDAIFALGDCARYAPADGSAPVPPSAQAAHQQARFLADGLSAQLRAGAVAKLAGNMPELPKFVFREGGALVSIGRSQAVGSIVGALTGRRFGLYGLLALWSYRALHRQHMVRLQGVTRTALATVANWISERRAPPIKLH